MKTLNDKRKQLVRDEKVLTKDGYIILEHFKYRDVKKAVLEFEKYINYMKEFSKNNWEKVYNYDLILNKFKEIFGEFEK